MMKPALSLGLQLGLLILAAVLLYAKAPSWPVAMPFMALLIGVGLTYIGIAPFIKKIYDWSPDSFYLVFVGLSGMRFLLFMAILVLMMVLSPEIKSVKATLGVTGWFLAAMVIEMSVFLTNLRRNSKKQS